MAQGSVLRFTREVARNLASDYSDRPREELSVWISSALEREAMVTRYYATSALTRRLTHLDADHREFIGRVVLGIWAEEEAHAKYLHSIEHVGRGNAAATLTAMWGRLQGSAITSATSAPALRRAVVRLCFALGHCVGKVPDFAAELDELGLRDFFSFSAELEETAEEGYRRIGQLLRAEFADPTSLSEAGAPPIGFPFHIDKIRMEEEFHRAAYNALASWLDERHQVTPGVSVQRMARELHAHANTIMPLSRLDADAARFAPHTQDLFSDGGVGSVLADAGYPLHVAPV